MGCSATHTPHVLRPNRRPADVALLWGPCIRHPPEVLVQSRRRTALAASYCTRAFTGLFKPSINMSCLRAELEHLAGIRHPSFKPSSNLPHLAFYAEPISPSHFHLSMRAPYRPTACRLRCRANREIVAMRLAHSRLASVSRLHLCRSTKMAGMTDHITTSTSIGEHHATAQAKVP